MKTKLTLSVEKETLHKARTLSKRRKTSVSRLFEEFVEQQERIQPLAQPHAVIDKLTGILKDEGLSYAQMKEEYQQARLRKK